MREEQRPLLLKRAQTAAPKLTVESDDENEFDDEDGSRDRPRDGDPENQRLLPLFSAAHLDRIPAYHLQHTIRLLVVRKVETTLSWDQLRTPQISQFLIKPIQQEIKNGQFTSATLYALLANSLQFQKDGQLNPGTVGLSDTRALVCELLAMRLLKDFSTRELIDALFYDFDPLQGLSARVGMTAPGNNKIHARLSAVEIAIRSSAKRFLAHPLVVQQFEAVWAGTIVFHSTADSLHRVELERAPRSSTRHKQFDYGAVNSHETTYSDNVRHANTTRHLAGKGKTSSIAQAYTRRTVTIYDPSEASLFKLSRLRVPRYRQLFSTISYAIMLGLFLAVLIERSTEITGLELVFWFWGAGYMLDELVGFSEQGFGLYIISVWNSFDIGILLLFISYYGLRLYGIIVPYDGSSRRQVANIAYDVLGTTAVLLFPRLFSVLDHYRYFSQLLIAFRMMAVDLAAILILIVICCSGFFVAFTFSFSDSRNDTRETAYTIFKIVMGFTPAAWDIWDDYNFLGKGILSVFLVICHFLIVTILITVLTNSFMAVVQNSNQEHQFLFAVNTISMVKSDALFSYIPPTNILGWMLSPIRFAIPFRQFVKINRTVIKATHVPMLIVIFIYERLILSHRVDPIDGLELRGRDKSKIPAFSKRGPEDLFSPGPRLREPSLATHRKDQALEEVFRQPISFARQGRAGEGRRVSLLRTRSTNIVDAWINGVGRDGGAATPVEQAGSVVDRLEARKPLFRRHRTTPVSHYFQDARSGVSEPDTYQPFEGTEHIYEEAAEMDLSLRDDPQQTDSDGDDELATNDDHDMATYDESAYGDGRQEEWSDKENRTHSFAHGSSHRSARVPLQEHNNAMLHDFGIEQPTRLKTAVDKNKQGHHQPQNDSGSQASTIETPATQQQVVPRRGAGQHMRTVSSATILFAPLDTAAGSSRASIPASPARSRGNRSSIQGPSTPIRSILSTSLANQSASAHGVQSPRKANPRNELPTTVPTRPLTRTSNMKSAPNLASFLASNRRNPSFNARALDLASDIGDNRIVPNADLLSASFGTQLEMAAMHRHRRSKRQTTFGNVTSEDDDNDGDADDDQDTLALRSRGGDTHRLNKLMLARMSNLEEGFRDMLREVKGLSQVHSRGSQSHSLYEDVATSEARAGQAKGKDKENETLSQ